ncbi:HD domain-containing protein [Clostridium estertheticum]|uniref:HD domain-containing protein n=1 Tax=Clostridium estertheticum TaxID=238834 RepID=UPI0013E99C1C|nr:HD domain-containing protein [Clostridium estertheticum]MBZ9686615.1 HD domain-containing protein [Clostridium estertheticum]
MLDRDKAEELLHKHLKNDKLVIHCYAVEAVMSALAKKLEPENEKEWGITGLLHDIDETTIDWLKNPELHGPTAVEILKAEGFGNERIYHAICAHNQLNGTKIISKMDAAAYAGDPITGFITAIALAYPDKKLANVKVKSIVKRMKDTRFAASANRQAMYSIVNLGMTFEEFAELSLNAMLKISDKLGL